ncbi:MAG: hypothetical protein ACOCVS_03660 [Planctomycetota bacterium]
MSDLQPLGDQTQKALGFLQQLILHMIINDVETYAIPTHDVPLDFTNFPYDIVTHDKILKAVTCCTDAHKGEDERVVRFEDTFTGIRYDFFFRSHDDGRSVTVTKKRV